MANEIHEHIEDWNLLDCAPKLVTRPVMLIGSEKDVITSVALNHMPLVQAFKNLNSTLMQQLLIDNTDHGYEGKRKALCHVSGKWLMKPLAR